jgi:hypothetical protein
MLDASCMGKMIDDSFWRLEALTILINYDDNHEWKERRNDEATANRTTANSEIIIKYLIKK